MILTRDQDIEYMRKIAERFFAALVLTDYGDDGLADLLKIIETAASIYKYIPLGESYEIVIYKTKNKANSLASKESSHFSVIHDYSVLASNSSKRLVFEVNNDDTVNVAFDVSLDIAPLRADSVVYEFRTGTETIFGKIESVTLDKAPGIVSYFAVPTYKSLSEALEHYKIHVARRSNCEYIRKTWFPSNQIFFQRSPEDNLKKSLHNFLSHYVRGEVKEEQNVDDSKPVDIKITWDFSSHIALIEVKWLGKSLEVLGQADFHQKMYDAEAISGANQLANYLDLHKPYSVAQVTKGYLVVFDARRWQTNTSTTTINRANGFHYENKEIQYNPEHHTIRDDFEKPVRFFMEPIVTV